MDLILITYLALILVGIIFSRSKNKDYLSRDITTSLRGIAAVGIVLHHMAEKTQGGVIFPYLEISGYLFVALFFFLSGYGLFVQYQNKESYLESFPKKRILYIVIIYLLDVIAYVAYGLLCGNRYSAADIIKGIFLGRIAMNTWYMVALIVFYIAFYLIFRYCTLASAKQKILLMFAFQIIFLLVCRILNAASIWYISNMGFVAGMIWAYKKEWIDGLLRRKYYRCLTIVSVVFAVFYVFPIAAEKMLAQSVLSSSVRLVCRQISTPSLICILMILLYKLKPDNSIWRFMGGISLEVYLIHGMIWSILRSDLVYVENEVLWTVLTLISSTLISVPISYFNKRISFGLNRKKES